MLWAFIIVEEEDLIFCVRFLLNYGIQIGFQFGKSNLGELDGLCFIGGVQCSWDVGLFFSFYGSLIYREEISFIWIDYLFLPPSFVLNQGIVNRFDIFRFFLFFIQLNCWHLLFLFGFFLFLLRFYSFYLLFRFA